MAKATKKTSIDLPDVPEGFSRAKGGNLNLVKFANLGDSVTGEVLGIDTADKTKRLTLTLVDGNVKEVAYVANIQKKFDLNKIEIGDMVLITLVANKNTKVFDVLFQKNNLI